MDKRASYKNSVIVDQWHIYAGAIACQRGRFCLANAALPLASAASLLRLSSSPAPAHRPQESRRRHQLTPRLLLAHASRRVCWQRPLGSWLVGVLLTPLRLCGTDASKRNGPCSVRNSHKISAAPPCGLLRWHLVRRRRSQYQQLLFALVCSHPHRACAAVLSDEGGRAHRHPTGLIPSPTTVPCFATSSLWK